MEWIFSAQICCFIAVIFVLRKRKEECRYADKLNKIFDNMNKVDK